MSQPQQQDPQPTAFELYIVRFLKEHWFTLLKYLIIAIIGFVTLYETTIKKLHEVKSTTRKTRIRQLKSNENQAILNIYYENLGYKCWPLPIIDRTLWRRYFKCLNVSKPRDLILISNKKRLKCLLKDEIKHCKIKKREISLPDRWYEEKIIVMDLKKKNYKCEYFNNIKFYKQIEYDKCLSILKKQKTIYDKRLLRTKCLIKSEICLELTEKINMNTVNYFIANLRKYKMADKYKCSTFLYNEPLWKEYIKCVGNNDTFVRTKLKCLIKVGKCNE